MKKIVYSPQGKKEFYNGSIVPNTRMIIDELLLSRQLILQWFLRDFKAKYKQTLLGWLWVIFMPIMTILIFWFMKNSGVIDVGRVKTPYPLYALVGLCAWGIFATGIATGSRVLIDSGSMLVKVNFPKATLVIASTAQGLVDFLIKIMLLVILFVYYGVTPGFWDSMLALLVACSIYFLTLGISFLTALVSGILRDLPNMINLGIMLLLFVTPVLYKPQDESYLMTLNSVNPLHHLVNGFRDILFYGIGHFTLTLAAWCLFSVAIFLVGLWLFYVLHLRITERL